MRHKYIPENAKAQANRLMDLTDSPQEWYLGIDTSRNEVLNQFYDDVMNNVNCLLMNEGYVLDVSTQMGLGATSLWKDDEKLYTIDFEYETRMFFNLTSDLDIEGDWDTAVENVARQIVDWYRDGIAK